jgi:hypothetical protein
VSFAGAVGEDCDAGDRQEGFQGASDLHADASDRPFGSA